MTTPGADLPTTPQLRLDPGMHSAPIRRIDVDAAGRYLVTGSHDKTVRVWSLEDGRLLRTIWLPQGEGDVGKVFAVAIAPDGELIAAGGWGPGADGRSNSIYLFERRGGRLLRHLDGRPNVIRHLAFAPDGRHLVAALGGDEGIRVFATAAWQEVAADPDYGGDSYWAAFDRDGRLATTSLDGNLRLYDAGFELTRKTEAPGGKHPFGIAFCPEGDRLALGYADSPRVDVLDGRTLAPMFQPDLTGVDNFNLSKIAWSEDGQTLHAAGRYGKNGKRPLRRWPAGGRGQPEDIALADNTVMDLRPLAAGRLAFGATDPSLGLLGADGEMIWRRDPAQAVLRETNGVKVSADGTSVTFDYAYPPESPARFDLDRRRLTLDPPTDDLLAAAVTSGHGLQIRDCENNVTPTLDGTPLTLKPYETSRSLAIAPDGERFLLGTEWYVRCFDRQGKELWQRPVPGIAWAVNVSGDGRLGIAAHGDGTIRWHRLEDGQELLAFFPHKDKERWVAWTPEGYYMAAPGGEALIGWLVNRGLDDAPEFHPVGAFRDRFHRPDVVTRILDTLDPDTALAAADAARGTKTLPAPNVADMLPPVIEILSPAEGVEIAGDRVTLRYRITGREGMSLPAITAYLDGQVILNQPAPPLALLRSGHEGQVNLDLRGWTNADEFQLGLIAEGEQSSEPAEILVRWTTRRPEVAKPNLYVLAIGVSKYHENPPRNLNYAAKDAEDFTNMMLGQAGRFYDQVKVNCVTDDRADLSGVNQGLRWLRQHVGRGDYVMLFLAGHGHAEGTDYYFLPHDVDSRTQYDLESTAVHKERLRRGLRELFHRSARVMAFFDTCYAGAAFEGGRSDLPPDMDVLAAELKEEANGVIVFTSCTGREIAREDEKWENGAFTEALLEAFSGQIVFDGQDHLRLSHLQTYLPDRVNALTGGQQNPRIYVPFERLWEAPIALLR